MVDIYICSSDKDEISGFCENFRNVIGPVSGRPAIAEQTLDDGTVIPASGAVGDVSKLYACIRTDAAPSLPDEISAADSEVGEALLGVWA